MIFRLAILLVITILLQACSTLGPRSLTMEQCQALDTYQSGLRDGQEGQESAISNIVQQCQVHNVNVDAPGYQRGYEQGLQIFCVPSTTFNLGKQGEIFPGYCASVVDVRTLQNEYNRGADLFVQMSALSNQIDAIDQQLNESDSINDQITYLENQLFELQKSIDFFGPDSSIGRDKILEARSVQRQIATLRVQLLGSAISSNPAARNGLLQQRGNLVAEITRLQLTN